MQLVRKGEGKEGVFVNVALLIYPERKADLFEIKGYH